MCFIIIILLFFFPLLCKDSSLPWQGDVSPANYLSHENFTPKRDFGAPSKGFSWRVAHLLKETVFPSGLHPDKNGVVFCSWDSKAKRPSLSKIFFCNASKLFFPLFLTVSMGAFFWGLPAAWGRESYQKDLARNITVGCVAGGILVGAVAHLVTTFCKSRCSLPAVSVSF